MERVPAADTVPQLLARRSAASGADAFLVCDDRVLTYAQLDERSRALAGELLGRGIGKGDRVAVTMPNGVDWAVLAFAVLRIGAVLVPLSTLLRPPELLAHLRVSAATALITARSYRSRRYVEDLEEELPGVLGPGPVRRAQVPALRQVWVWGEDLPAEPGPCATAPPFPDVRAADDLAVLFTSGSRGAPKGVLHTHGSALRAVAAGLEARCVRAGDRLYIPMPFFWAGGFSGGLLTAFVGGATLLTELEPEPARTIAFLEREQVSLFRGWPDQGARIAAHPSFDPARLPHLRLGSLDAVLPPDRRAEPGARANLFGMTETFGPYAGFRLDTDLPADKRGSCGRPFDGVEVRIADPTTGRPVAPGADGQILVRGATVLRGICGREREEVFDPDGYYPTGDLGRLDRDGFLWYLGRLDDMLKVRGATVYPAEVEKALRSLAGVRQAVVTGVEVDGRTEVGALVVGELDDPAGLSRAAAAVLSSFKVPTLWCLRRSDGDVPRLASDKPDVAALRRLLLTEGMRAAR